MDSFTLDILINHALSGLRHEAFEGRQYNNFYTTVADLVGHMASVFLRHEDPWNVGTPTRLFAVMRVFLGLRPVIVDGEGVVVEHNFARVRTWADFARIFRDVLVTHNLVDSEDNITFFKVVMFMKNMRSQLGAPIVLASRIIAFILHDAAPVAAGVVADPEEPEVQEAAGVVADPEEPEVQEAAGVVADPEEPEVQEAAGVVADPEEPEAAGVVADLEEPEVQEATGVVVAEPEEPEEPEAAGVVADLEEPEAAGVVADLEEPEEPEAAGVVAEPEPRVDEDGDVIMETVEKASKSRGSKRRRGRALSYETEMSRVTEAKRRYNLRDTRAREERMTNLKEAEDSKRKAEGAESSSKGSRKRSRR